MAKLNHVFGNYFSLRIPLVMRTRTVIDGEETDTDTEYTPSPSESVSVRLIRRKGRAFSYIPTVDGSTVTIEDEGKLPLGTYDVEVTITGGEHPMRFCDEATIEVHYDTEAAGIVSGETLTATTYTLEGAVFFAMGSGGGDSGITLYYVNVTNNGDDTYTADKTFVEIKAAYENGNLVFVKYNGVIMNLVGFMQDSFVLFSQAGGSIITTIMIGSRNEVLFATHSLPTKLSDLQNDLLFATQQWVNEQNFLKQHQDISGKEDKIEIIPFTTSAAAITAQFGYNKIGFEVNTLAITLPTVGANETNLKGLLIKFTTGANPDVSFTNNNVIFAESYEVAANSIVELNAICDDEYWYVTSQKFNTQNS